MEKIIQHKVFYPNPAVDVWAYLTEPELMAQWLMPNDFKAELGHKFTFNAGCMPPEFNFDGIFYCEVLEIAPPKKLVYSWDFGPGDGTLNRSEVHWALTEKNNGTEVLLTHRSFKGAEVLPIFIAMDKGWLGNMNKILKKLNPEPDAATTA